MLHYDLLLNFILENFEEREAMYRYYRYVYIIYIRTSMIIVMRYNS